ncbi:uncharacterized protein LOC122668676 [Telopea speciosissima]|uniref:uncharacterized protein LOC122668676 n=1 Tax=Telopea speciosissima TaxID=54955 RepID=UPI001CC71C15|nr:uncharacterized protein LOC122668676 [Telopea speciosissima]
MALHRAGEVAHARDALQAIRHSVLPALLCSFFFLEVGVGSRRRRFWRIKVTPKLRFFAGINSPKKFFQRLRDGYVKMMLRFANSRVFISGYGGGRSYGFGEKSIAMKEYDEKMIVEIYKSMMAEGILLPRDAARLASVTTTAAAVATPIGIAC